MATYYNHKSVRDQLVVAKKKSKCDFFWGIPRNVKALCIDAEWTANCSDLCHPGRCEVRIHICLPGIPAPQTVNLYYVKKEPIAYVDFLPQVLMILTKKGILKYSELHIEKDAPKVLSGSNKQTLT